jgi:hypothetical protein
MMERGRERKKEREIKKDEDVRVEGRINDTKKDTKILTWKPLKGEEQPRNKVQNSFTIKQ